MTSRFFVCVAVCLFGAGRFTVASDRTGAVHLPPESGSNREFAPAPPALPEGDFLPDHPALPDGDDGISKVPVVIKATKSAVAPAPAINAPPSSTKRPPHYRGDPQKDPGDNEGRAKILSAVQAPVRHLEEYQNWPMLTPDSVDVSEGTFFRCNIGSGDLEAWKLLNKSQGIHWSPAIRVYANATAKAAIDDKKGKFPPGSVLVKEKLMQRKVVAITAMIRERDGYDYSDQKNNWRYFYVDEREEMQFGRIKSCRECHQSAAETDFAFLKYSTHRGQSSGP